METLNFARLNGYPGLQSGIRLNLEAGQPSIPYFEKVKTTPCIALCRQKMASVPIDDSLNVLVGRRAYVQLVEIL